MPDAGVCISKRTLTGVAAMFQEPLQMKESPVGMALEVDLAAMVVLTTAVGFVMTIAGLKKHRLEWRRRQRVCWSCGRLSGCCSCATDA
jgi:hypothetical protein